MYYRVKSCVCNKLLSVESRIIAKKYVGTFFNVFKYFDPVIFYVLNLKKILLYTKKALFKGIVNELVE